MTLSEGARRLGISESYLQQEGRAQLDRLRKRRALYTPVRPPIPVEGREVIVVDDGLATGATMIAALQALRPRGPARLVVATAVSPPETLEQVEALADEVVCLEVPSEFFAVGQFFTDFEQVEDDEVIAVLQARGPGGPAGGAAMSEASRRLAAVLFDFDGVIVDTEPLHCEAFRQVIEPLGLELPWATYQREYIGFDDRDTFRAIFRDTGRALSEETLPELIGAKAEAFSALAETRGVEPYPGVAHLIHALVGRVPLALCSGALRGDMEPILDRIGLADCFTVLVTAEDVAVSKPDPESYLEALKRLACRFPDRDFPPAACVAIEDTPAGITAARGAGVRVLSVLTTHGESALGGADRVVASLEGLTLMDLEALVRS
jgi:beta-phosphoglucomutase